VEQKSIPLDEIRIDGGTQPRAEIDTATVSEYAEAMQAGVSFPPVDVFHDGKHYWLAEGFHRWHGARKAGRAEILCVVHPGTVEDARWFALGANKTHGLRRKREDVQRAVEAALKAKPSLSDSKIAEHVGVTDKTVTAARKRLESTSEIPKSDARTGRDGRTTNTSGIGKGKKESGGKKATTTSEGADEEPDYDVPDIDPDDDLDQREKKARGMIHDGDSDDIVAIECGMSIATVEAIRQEYCGELAREGTTPEHQKDAEEFAADKTPVVLDEVGIPVPEAILAAWVAAVERKAELRALLRKAQQLLDVLCQSPGGEYLARAVGLKVQGERRFYHSRHVEALLQELRFNLPYAAACPYCHQVEPGSSSKECDACHGMGWVAERAWESAPSDYKERTIADLAGEVTP
jgi:hypothetical protein